jgi:cell division protein FtsL
MKKTSEIKKPKTVMKPGKKTVQMAATFLIAMVVTTGCQLWLSMALAEDVYRLSDLKRDYREISRELQIIEEEVLILSSPENLYNKATKLGMVHGDDVHEFMYLED